jgi:ArsR family transcriptional regulator
MQNLINTMKALSEETRLRILKLIMERECCVCEVMQALDISQTRASRNLTILYKAGFLKLRKDGLWSHYSIDEEIEAWMTSILEAVDKNLKDNATVLRDLANLKKAKKLGQTCCKGERVN